jgi:hypothetical protein
VIKLRPAPAVFTDVPPPADYFRFRVTPTHTIAIGSFVKVPGDTLRGESVDLTVSEHEDPAEVSACAAENNVYRSAHDVAARSTAIELETAVIA